MALTDLTPATRIEEILAGEEISPATRLEYFLQQAAQGGGGSAPVVLDLTGVTPNIIAVDPGASGSLAAATVYLPDTVHGFDAAVSAFGTAEVVFMMPLIVPAGVDEWAFESDDAIYRYVAITASSDDGQITALGLYDNDGISQALITLMIGGNE